MKDIVVLYHAECPDGFGAAWAAYNNFGNNADYIGVHHNHPAPEGLENKDVYLVDFVYPKEIMEELISRNKRVTAIDHHVSGEEAVKLTKDYSYSVDHSGSVLAWMYFNDKSVPKLLYYIEDRDLFQFKLLNSNSICVFIDSFDQDFEVWNKLAQDIEDENKRDEVVVKGDIILKYEEELIKQLVKENAKLVEFEGFQVYVVNAPHEFASQIGKVLYQIKPPVAIIWSEDKERVNISLRSDKSVDVSEIAVKFGGGGHKGAAGFNLPALGKFPWKEVK